MTKRIFRSTFAVAAVVLLASFVLITGVLYEYFSNKQMDQLNMQTHLAAQGVESAGADYFSDMDIDGCRITWIAADGTVLFDSRAQQSGMENHADREEVQQALKTGHGESMRYSTTLMERQLYSADRLSDGSVVRISDMQYTPDADPGYDPAGHHHCAACAAAVAAFGLAHVKAHRKAPQRAEP